jgi:phosphohistidine phosphatase
MASLILTERQTAVYFIRHGIAAERGTYANDDDRPLTAKGIRRTQQVAERLQSLGIQFDGLLSSPLIRAQQTAQLIKTVGLCAQVETFAPLSPGGILEDWLVWLGAWQATGATRLALVGHEPDLSRWAQQLVAGQTHDRWVLKKAGVIGVQVPSAKNAVGNSELFLLVPPRLFL